MADQSRRAGADHATHSDFMRVSVRVLGRVLAMCVGIRDAYYGSIDELERAVCAP
jgi:hypothetical protein